jgi:hypothetical protein
MSLWSYGLMVQTLWKQKYKDLTPRGPPSVREEMNNIQKIVKSILVMHRQAKADLSIA